MYRGCVPTGACSGRLFTGGSAEAKEQGRRSTAPVYDGGESIYVTNGCNYTLPNAVSYGWCHICAFNSVVFYRTGETLQIHNRSVGITYVLATLDS